MPVKAGFVEPMLLLRTDALPDDPRRSTYQLKLDGYRAIAYKTNGCTFAPVTATISPDITHR